MLLSHFFSRVLNQNHRIVCFCFFWHIFTRSVLKFKRWHFTLTHLASFKSGLLHFVLFSHFNYLRGKKKQILVQEHLFLYSFGIFSSSFSPSLISAAHKYLSFPPEAPILFSFLFINSLSTEYHHGEQYTAPHGAFQ